MTLAHLFMLAMAVGQTTGGAERPETPDRSAILSKALSDFEAAAALGVGGGAESRRLYAAARDGFARIIHSGVENGRLYYNLANCHLRLGDVGLAIVNYRRALRLMPGDARVRKNLHFARSLPVVRISKPAVSAMLETLLFWHYGTSLAARTHVLIAVYGACWGLLIALRLLPRCPPVLRWTVGGLAALGLVVGASVAWQRGVETKRIEGVLVADDVVLRKGNGDYYEPQFDRPLSQGVEFRLIEDRADVEGNTWYHVELPDGKDGWLRSGSVEII